MTLRDIIISALAQLDRDCDAASIAACRVRFTRFANDAQHQLAEACALTRTDMLSASHGVALLSSLPRECLKVVDVVQQEHSVPFRSGDASNKILLPYSSPALITYRYEPMPLERDNDVCELEPYLGGLIVTYVVGRERLGGDVTTQSGGNIYLSMYESAKAKLRTHRGTQDSYMIKNRF